MCCSILQHMLKYMLYYDGCTCTMVQLCYIATQVLGHKSEKEECCVGVYCAGARSHAADPHSKRELE